MSTVDFVGFLFLVIFAAPILLLGCIDLSLAIIDNIIFNYKKIRRGK